MARSTFVAALAGALLVAGCGARWTDEQASEIAARRAGSTAEGAAQTASAVGGGGGGVAPGSGSGSASTTTVAGGGGPAGAGSSSATGAPVGGGAVAGSPDGDTAGATLPCAAPSDAPGVSDTEIRVATISSLSGPVPGLGASAAAATRAYVAFRNATGGVCGRQIVLDEADDGTDTGRYRALVTEVAERDLGIVGGFSVGDVGGEDVIRATGIPVVSVVSSDDLTALPTVFDLYPPFADPDGVIGKYRYLYEQGVRTVSVVYIAVQQSRSLAAVEQQLMQAAGLEVVQVQELPVSTLSYDAPARSVVNSGADFLWFTGPAEGNAGMARSLADAGAQLDVAEYFTLAYGTAFIDAAGPAAEGAVTWLRTLPAEEVGSNEELTTYVEWMASTAPDQPPDDYGSNAWVGAKAFFDTLEQLPGPITREALVAQLASVGTFDAGGMMGAVQLGAKVTNACYVGLRVEGGEWRRFAPASGFLC